jgi:hypothetical protein
MAIVAVSISVLWVTAIPVSIYATLLRREDPKKVGETFDTLVARINVAWAAEAVQVTKH